MTDDDVTGDDDLAISYRLLKRGTPIHASDGTLLGITDRVLDNTREDIFDGIVMKTDAGERFVDAPEVGRITEQRVTLTIDATQAADLPHYEPGAPEFGANVRAGRIGRLFGGDWKRQ